MTTDRVAEVYRVHHARLWRSLYAFTGDREVASDAEAEAFTQAIRRGAAIDDIAAWVWRAAFRIATGMLDDRNRRTTAESGRVEWSRADGSRSSSAAETSPTAPLAVEPVASSEQMVAEFLGLLGPLSAQQRAVVALRYLAELTGPEIAAVLATSPETVRTQLHRAHVTLRRVLAPTTEENR